MDVLGSTSRKWLKGLHLVAVCSWVGGALALTLLHFLKSGVTDGGELYGINRAIHHVDMLVVVIPGAFGCLLTGLAYSALTGWGFFRHGWIFCKWVVTIAAILFGTFCLGPWEERMMELSGLFGAEALSNAEYLRSQTLNFYWGGAQLAVLTVMVFISIFKPWKHRAKQAGE
ncbi:hypothetical protein [Pseudodesulfovibrio tunisiensis]|uniref:hypothetical protein n=1 Tax=Pseudodesulfovibrio tunisiensis TaxID=463192 RepID=UPI001FB4FC93|nr:hypothetical protein [Pseudodesulfovibrio tunisiensis]